MKAAFTGGEVSSDGGVLLLRQADRKLGLTSSVARALTETRRKKSCRHSLVLRPYQLSCVVGESVPPALVFIGLSPDGGNSPIGSERYRAFKNTVLDYTPETAENRCRHSP